MKDENEIHIAWEIWNLIARLNDLIWDRYEDQFIDICLEEEEEEYINRQIDHQSPVKPSASSTRIQNAVKTSE